MKGFNIESRSHGGRSRATRVDFVMGGGLLPKLTKKRDIEVQKAEEGGPVGSWPFPVNVER